MGLKGLLSDLKVLRFSLALGSGSSLRRMVFCALGFRVYFGDWGARFSQGLGLWAWDFMGFVSTWKRKL